MSSKKIRINWPPNRTVAVNGILKGYQRNEIMEIQTEDSYRVGPNAQRDGIGE